MIRHAQYDGKPETNITQDIIGHTLIHDLRPTKDDLTLEKDGFIVAKLTSGLAHALFSEQVAVKEVFVPEVDQLLKSLFNSQNVAILECLVSDASVRMPSVLLTTL